MASLLGPITDSSDKNSPHSCRHCQRILIKPPIQRGQHGFRYRLPHTKSDARQAARDGCPLFKLFIQGYNIGSSSHGSRDLARGLQHHGDWKYPRAGAFSAQDRIIYFAESLSQRPFQIRFSEKSDVLLTCMGWGSLWFKVTARADNPAAAIFPTTPMSRTFGSEAAFDLANRWLNDCVSHSADSIHRECLSVSVERSTFVPTRLLEISSINGLIFVRLYQTGKEDSLRYCCLSYCWGGDQPVKTTLSSLRTRQNGIIFADLPQTLQDAISVTLRLELRFIWIDCLCIIQDDLDDMGTEIGLMPLIYKHAQITISASSAKNCHEGFLGARPAPSNSECEDITLRYRRPDGHIGDIHLSEYHPYESNEDPINTRAWTLQERLLSPRVLDYGVRQLRWHCRSRRRFDGGFPDEILEGENTSSGLYLSALKLPSESQAAVAAEKAIFSDWADFVDDYTKRSLSFPSDKLVALSALASEICQARLLSYRAGLWLEDLPVQLLWRLWEGPARRPEYRAPSWSWAAVDGWVMMQREADGRRIDIEVLECVVDPLHPVAVYGAVKSGYLTVKGRVRLGSWFYNREGKITIDGLDEASFAVSPLPDPFENELSAHNSEGSSLSEGSEEIGDDPLDGTIDGVELIRDALEDGWAEADLDASAEVLCLQILAQSQDGTQGATGILLFPSSRLDGEAYRRVGYFFFDARKEDCFRDVDPRTLTIY